MDQHTLGYFHTNNMLSDLMAFDKTLDINLYIFFPSKNYSTPHCDTTLLLGIMISWHRVGCLNKVKCTKWLFKISYSFSGKIVLEKIFNDFFSKYSYEPPPPNCDTTLAKGIIFWTKFNLHFLRMFYKNRLFGYLLLKTNL